MLLCFATLAQLRTQRCAHVVYSRRLFCLFETRMACHKHFRICEAFFSKRMPLMQLPPAACRHSRAWECEQLCYGCSKDSHVAHKYHVPHLLDRGCSVVAWSEKIDEWVLAAAMSCHLLQWMSEACVCAAEDCLAVCLAAATFGAAHQHVSMIVSALARIWLHGSPPGHSFAYAVLDLRL
jgi:hypothetical protein